MCTIPNRTKFQPSAQTIQKCLATRKNNYLFVGGNNYPRYLSSTGNSADSLWFMVAIVGELVGLGTTIAGGARSGGAFLIFASITVIMFIFCDFFFAVKLHRNKARNCRLDSEEILLDADDHAGRAAIRAERSEGRFADFWYKTGIILIAIIKLIGIVLLGVFGQLILYAPFAIIYLIVSYVHINHTGYYFAFMATENSMNKEHNKWAIEHRQNPHQPHPLDVQPHQQQLETLVPLNMPIQYALHRIEIENETNNYMIHSTGILTDDDIVGLTTGQNPQNQVAIFKACRTRQLAGF